MSKKVFDYAVWCLLIVCLTWSVMDGLQLRKVDTRLDNLENPKEIVWDVPDTIDTVRLNDDKWLWERAYTLAVENSWAIDSMIKQHKWDYLNLLNKTRDLRAQLERLDWEIPKPKHGGKP